MRTNHDDFIHPVPPIAYLRWKENYFFVIMCVKQGVFGVAHVNCEPLFGHARFACQLSVSGRSFHYASETPLPKNFGFAPQIGDGKMNLRILESDRKLQLSVEAPTFSLDAQFVARAPSFEFGACRYGAPENYSFREAMTFGMNLPLEHIQQAMNVSGRLSIRAEDRALTLEGPAYRDHSWGIRSDNTVAWHTWSGLLFANRTFGIMTLETLYRTGLIAREGYVTDDSGSRVLRTIAVSQEGDDGTGVPKQVRFEVQDVYGQPFIIEADVAGRLAQVRHENEKGDQTHGSSGYSMTENFCLLRVPETGEEGIGLVELGRSSVSPLSCGQAG